MEFPVLVDKLLQRMAADDWDPESMAWIVTNILEIYKEGEEAKG